MAIRGTADRGAPPPPSTGTGSLTEAGARQVRQERSGRLSGSQLAMPLGLIVVILALVIVAAATGSSAVVVAIGVLIVLIAAFAVIYGIGARRATARDAAEQPAGEAREAARAEPMPAAFMNAEPDVALGDTVQAHDEINPHDLPPDHPGREAAEKQAGGSAGTTRGDAELNDAAPSREREGEPGN